VQSLNHTVCKIVQQLLEVRVHNLAKLAKDVLKDRCQISNHLCAVQKVAFFEAYFLQEFCSFLVEEVNEILIFSQFTIFYVLSQILLNNDEIT